MVNFRVPEFDPCHVVAYFATVEDIEDLVAFTVIGCPVNGQEPPGLAVDAEFFAQLSLAGRGGGFADVNVTAGDVPLISVGLAHQQQPVVIDEQRPSGDTGSGELRCRVGHRSTVGGWLGQPQTGREPSQFEVGFAA